MKTLTTRIFATFLLALVAMGGQVAFPTKFLPSASADVLLPDAPTPALNMVPSASGITFTVYLTNYDPAFTYTYTVGSGTPNVRVLTSPPSWTLAVGGLSPNVTTPVTVTASADGFNSTTTAITGATKKQLIPTLSTPVLELGGWSALITNYDPTYTWSVQARNCASATIFGDTISCVGLSDNILGELQITSSRADSIDGVKLLSAYSIPHEPALVPVFDTPLISSTGFQVQILNYDPDFAWSFGSPTGDVFTSSIDSSGLLTIDSLAMGQEITIRAFTDRYGYLSANADIVVTLNKGDGLVPELGNIVRTADSITAQVLNFDGNYVWYVEQVDGSSATVSLEGDRLYIRDLQPGQSVRFLVRTGQEYYLDVEATFELSSLPAPSTPLAGPITSVKYGFSFQILNYEPTFTYFCRQSVGNCVISETGLVTISGMGENTFNSVFISAFGNGVTSELAQVDGTSTPLDAALTPTVGVVTNFVGGFGFQILNYDANFTWDVIPRDADILDVQIDESGYVTVTTVGQLASKEVYVTANRYGYLQGYETVVGHPLLEALNPVFGEVQQTIDGFTVQILNWDPAFSWAVMSDEGTASIGSSGLVSVVGLAPGVGTFVLVITEREGYDAGGSAAYGNALNPALTPTFGERNQTEDGYTVSILNYDDAYEWSVEVLDGSSAHASISSTGVVTVTGTAYGQLTRLQVNASRNSFLTGSSVVDGYTLALPLAPTYSNNVRRVDGFDVQISNYDALYTYSFRVDSGTVSFTAPNQLSVRGLAAGEGTVITITLSRSGYMTWSYITVGMALEATTSVTNGDAQAAADAAARAAAEAAARAKAAAEAKAKAEADAKSKAEAEAAAKAAAEEAARVAAAKAATDRKAAAAFSANASKATAAMIRKLSPDQIALIPAYVFKKLPASAVSWLTVAQAQRTSRWQLKAMPLESVRAIPSKVLASVPKSALKGLSATTLKNLTKEQKQALKG